MHTPRRPLLYQFPYEIFRGTKILFVLENRLGSDVWFALGSG
jgi:hypothetical protein